MRPHVKDETADKADTTTVRKRKATDTMGAQQDTTNTPKQARLSLADTPASLAIPAHAALLDSLTSSPVTPPTTPSKPQKSSNRKQRIPNDPLNISIYELRKEGREWDDIALRTNQACGLVGENELSGAACYSRFSRNGPLVAKQKGEEFKKEWYVHMKSQVAASGSAGTNGVQQSGKEDEPSLSDTESAVLLSAVEKARTEFWSNVTAVVNKQLVSSRSLTEEEVKFAYDRIKRDDD